MHKKKVVQAINNYLASLDPKPTSFRKNEKPEKEVEKSVLAWCKQNGLFVSVVESKAVFSQGANRFLKGQAQSGFPDLVVLIAAGLFVAIELKAKGRRSSVRVNQYNFLKQVIQNQGFAAVVDCQEYLETLYFGFLKEADQSNRKNYLMSCLPVPRELKEDNTPIF
jgi:hypothetical protein